MKILHVIDSDGLYGAEAVLLNLMEPQKRMGLHPSLLSIGATGIHSKVIEIEATKRGLECSPLRFQNGFNLRGSRKILQHAITSGADIVHSHGYKGDILLGIIPRRLRKVPVITTQHGWTSTSFFSKMRLYEWIDTLLMKNLDGVVVVSSAMQNHPRLRMLGIRPVVINNGLPCLNFELDAFLKECPEVAKDCQNKFKIISVGRLSHEKGVSILIHAVAGLLSRNIDICLVLVGEGSEGFSLQDLAKNKGLSDRVHFVGYREKAYQLFPYFDLFVLPSYTEGLPITLLEAMQAGVPIVATRVGEVPKVLDEGRYGRIVPPGDPEELMKGILEVYENRDQAKKKALLARDRVLAEYGVEKMATKYLDLYRSVLSGTGVCT